MQPVSESAPASCTPAAYDLNEWHERRDPTAHKAHDADGSSD